jgi:hypothetical protein
LYEVLEMSSPIIDCPEVVGKTVSSLKLHATDCEIIIEFTDGTSFSSACESRAVHKAALIRTGMGTPEVLKTYTD